MRASGCLDCESGPPILRGRMKIVCLFSLEEGSEGRTGEVLEQTDRGFFLASNMLYPPGTRLSLIVTDPAKRLPARLHGEVTWARSSDVAGMYVELAPATESPVIERAEPGPTETPKKPRGPALSS